jgi:hypothetical protein
MSEITATLPTNWDEVPLLPFCHLLAARTLNEKVAATAVLVGVEAEQLLGNMRAYTLIEADLAFMKELPQPTEAPVDILHAGVRYHHVGNLSTISAGQLEALTAFLREYEEQPVLAGPSLLAVLYKPAGLSMLTWDAEAISAAAKAFEVLPVSLAWPALTSFLVATGPLALIFQQYSAARVATENLLKTVEASLPPPGASLGWWQKQRSGAVRAWIKSARSRLTL